MRFFYFRIFKIFWEKNIITHKMKMRFAIQIALLTTLFLPEVLSLNCYLCHSENETNCNDPFPLIGDGDNGTGYLIDCLSVSSLKGWLDDATKILNKLASSESSFNLPSTHTNSSNKACYKLLTKSGTLMRGCGDICSNLAHNNQSTSSCLTCSQDYCNTSSLHQPLHSIIALFIILAVKGYINTQIRFI